METPTVVVFHPEWLACVVRAQCYPKDHACGPYYICPAFMKGTHVEALSYNPHHPPPLPEPKSKRKTANMHNPSTVCSCPTGPSTPKDPCISPCGEDEHLQYLSSHLFNTQGEYCTLTFLSTRSVFKSFEKKGKRYAFT